MLGSEVDMSASGFAIFVVTAALGGSVAALAAPKAQDAPGEPKLISVHPFTGQRGATFVATVRGNSLHESTSVFVDNAPFTAVIEGSDSEPADKPGKPSVDLIRLRVRVDANAKTGRYPFRLVTQRGISTPLSLHVLDAPVIAEPAGPHETPDTAIPVDNLPAVFNGRIAQRGEHAVPARQIAGSGG